MTKEARKVLKFPEGRQSFLYLSTPRPKPPRSDGTVPEPKYETTVLLDPAIPAHAKSIAELKAAAQALAASDPKLAGTPMKKLILAFGNGDKKAQDEDGEANSTYEAYKGMFYVQLSSTMRPLIGDRLGREIADKNHAQFPYSGCYANVKGTLFAWHHPPTNRRGISVDFRSVQFVKDGPAFGRGAIDAETEFEPLEDGAGAPAAAGDDDWD